MSEPRVIRDPTLRQLPPGVEAEILAGVERIQCSPEILEALIRVESEAYFDDPLPHRFERAKFRKMTGKIAVSFRDALALNRKAALECSSWGYGQIMGFNHAVVGYESAEAMVEAFRLSVAAQIRAVMEFLINRGLAAALRGLDAQRIAEVYNGSGYAVNAYDIKLMFYFGRLTGQGTAHVLRLNSEGDLVRLLQERLKQLGHYAQTVDNSFGPQTEAAVKAFQRSKKLRVDGVVARMTWTALDLASAPGVFFSPPTQRDVDDATRTKATPRDAAVGAGSITIGGLLTWLWSWLSEHWARLVPTPEGVMTWVRAFSSDPATFIALGAFLLALAALILQILNRRAARKL